MNMKYESNLDIQGVKNLYQHDIMPHYQTNLKKSIITHYILIWHYTKIDYVCFLFFSSII